MNALYVKNWLTDDHTFDSRYDALRAAHKVTEVMA